jgi:hypothetical protein
LCNASDGEATRAANDVSRLYLDKSGRGIISGTSAGVSRDLSKTPAPAATLSDYLGDYWSDEAETKLTAQIDGGRLVLTRRPGTLIALDLVGKDTFRGQIGTVTFHRTAAGSVDSLSIKQDRVWDLRFARQDGKR